MSHVKHLLMSCLLTLAAIGLQSATPLPAAKVETPAQQPVSPFTITVKQTGTPSWKTFNRVPVEISITNNTDKEINLDMPYFKNISLWNAKRIGCYIARIAMLTGIALTSINTYLILEILTKNLFATIGLLDGTPNITIPYDTNCTSLPNGELNCTSNSTSLIPSAYNPMFFHMLAFMLVHHSRSSFFSTKYLLPGKTITFKGSISSNDIQKIKAGLQPEMAGL